MTTTNSTHADFARKGSALTARQIAWLAANGIETKPGERFGFYFFKGDVWVEPVAATATDVTVMIVDTHEDGDGARCVGTYPRLRDALRIIGHMTPSMLTAE